MLDILIIRIHREMFSTVLLPFSLGQSTKLVMDGRHNADKEWIAELRMKGDALVLPRVVLEANPLDLLTNKKQRNKAVNLIITECKEMGYDGIVLESWSRWAAYGVLHDPKMRYKRREKGKRVQAYSSQDIEGILVKSPDTSYGQDVSKEAESMKFHVKASIWILLFFTTF